MAADAEVARVRILDVDLRPGLVVGKDELPEELSALDTRAEAGRVIRRWTTTPRWRRLSEDWREAAEPVLAEVAPGGESERLRFEWIGDADEWLDVIGKGPGDSLFRLRLRAGEEGPEVSGLQLEAGPGRIGVNVMRQLGVPLGSAYRALGSDPSLGALAGGKWRRRVRRPGRAGTPDADYADWAKRYVDAMELAPRAPVKHLIEMERQAGRHATEAQVRAYISKARRRGLLTPAPSGQPGGQLTPLAQQVLGGGA